ncbi:MAG TPA: hypothetical protein VNA87_00185 [Actinomycetota bacterium]|nr:hypothetical protein [Actinomycetota bacterium]
MSKEQIKILEMVAEGTISVEEGEKLLETLSEPTHKTQKKVRVMPEDEVDLEDLFNDLPQAVNIASGIARGAVRSGFAKRIRLTPDRGDTIVGSNLGFDKLVKLGTFGISPKFLKELKEAGIKDLTFDEIISFGVHGVSPAYVKEMKTRFGDDISYKQITKLATFGIDADFVDGIKQLGLDLSYKQIIKLGVHGISPKYIQEMVDAGVLNLETSEVEDMVDSAITDIEVDADDDEE